MLKSGVFIIFLIIIFSSSSLIVRSTDDNELLCCIDKEGRCYANRDDCSNFEAYVDDEDCKVERCNFSCCKTDSCFLGFKQECDNLQGEFFQDISNINECRRKCEIKEESEISEEQITGSESSIYKKLKCKDSYYTDYRAYRCPICPDGYKQTCERRNDYWIYFEERAKCEKEYVSSCSLNPSCEKGSMIEETGCDEEINKNEYKRLECRDGFWTDWQAYKCPECPNGYKRGCRKGNDFWVYWEEQAKCEKEYETECDLSPSCGKDLEVSSEVCETPKCSDGTFINTCVYERTKNEEDRPLYCNENKELIENCKKCGCGEGYECQDNGKCVLKDTTPPSISITPTFHATVSRKLNISGEVKDDIGIQKVELYLDVIDKNNLLGVITQPDITSTYSFVLDTTTITQGSHLLIARAYDTSNNVATNSATIKVDNELLGAICTTLKREGDPKNKLNIIFVADGYSNIEDLFKEDVNKFINQTYNFGPFSISPFKENLQKINFYRIDIIYDGLAGFGSLSDEVSNEGKTFNINKIDRIIQSCFNWDISSIIYQVFILGNKANLYSSYAAGFPSQFGKMGYGYVALFTRVNGKQLQEVYNAIDEKELSETATHEFGHSFGDLADEYVNLRPISNTIRVNCDTTGCPKWCGGKINQDASCYPKLKKHLDCIATLPPDKDSGYCWDIISEQCLKEYNNDFPLCAQIIEQEKEEVYDCNVGMECKSATGCYFNCKGTNGYRSSISSVMRPDGRSSEFNEISKEHLRGLLSRHS